MAKARNSIIISGIVLAFIAGAITANPVVEAAGGWKGAFDDLINGITAVNLNPASTIGGSSISTGAHPVPILNVQKVLGSVTTASGTGAFFSSTATCPPGTTLTGGGHETFTGSSVTDALIFRSTPGPLNDWRVTVNYISGPDWDFRAVALCATITT